MQQSLRTISCWERPGTVRSSLPFVSTGSKVKRMISRLSASSGSSNDENMTTFMDRRALMLSLITGVALSGLDSVALAQEYETFLGTATPPTSYGGYGGNADEEPKYMFEYPAGWKASVPNKVEKGTQGIDCRVTNMAWYGMQPRNKGQKITVVTFGRAGEDNKSFKLSDIETTIAGFAGADYDLQDAMSIETNRVNNEREIDGEKYYDVEIESPDVSYFITVTVKYGKVFALFVKTPTRSLQSDGPILRHVVETFKTL